MCVCVCVFVCVCACVRVFVCVRVWGVGVREGASPSLLASLVIQSDSVICWARLMGRRVGRGRGRERRREPSHEVNVKNG